MEIDIGLTEGQRSGWQGFAAWCWKRKKMTDWVDGPMICKGPLRWEFAALSRMLEANWRPPRSLTRCLPTRLRFRAGGLVLARKNSHCLCWRTDACLLNITLDQLFMVDCSVRSGRSDQPSDCDRLRTIVLIVQRTVVRGSSCARWLIPESQRALSKRSDRSFEDIHIVGARERLPR